MLPAMSGGPEERRAAVALSAIISWAGQHAERLHRPRMLAEAPAT